MQRLIDLLLAVIAIVLTSPLWMLCLVAILVSDPGNPFFVHKRVGQNGREFGLLKFRTMRALHAGAGLTIAGDKRVTPVGRILRRSKLDEIPQLANVILGQMSLVGPRPETPEFVAVYTAEQRDILGYKPGLTDPASLKFRHEEKLLAKFPDPVDAYQRVVLPEKIAIALEYQRHRTILSDFAVMARTIIEIFRSPEAARDETS